ncbi:MAG: DNA polymerase I [Actinobacteria bacterium]|nr:DNA polymerase I [Actinomycetota bacterium]
MNVPNVLPTGDACPQPEDVSSRPLFFIDGNNLAYRAFFALPEEISTSTGFPTNALYGFSAMLIKIIADYRPTVVVVAWDSKEMTFRRQEFEEYKAQRKPMPEGLSEQWPLFAEIAAAFGFVNVNLPGYEADDILGTLARQAERDGRAAVIVTGDRDALQLVTDRVHVMANTRGVTDVRIYDPAAVHERFGVTPEQIPDFIGLKGDTSDNIPGVPGVGEKTAASLLAQFGDLESTLAQAETITATKRREALLAHREQALMAKRLATLDREAPIDIHAAELQVQHVDGGALAELFARLEFSSLMDRLEQVMRTETAVPSTSDAVEGPDGAVVATRVVAPHQLESAFDRGLPAAVVVSQAGDRAWIVQCGGARDEVLEAEYSPTTRPLLRDLLREGGLICHDFKSAPMLHDLAVYAAHDTYLAAYLLAPGLRSYRPEELAAGAGLRPAACGPDDPDTVRLILELAGRQEASLREQGMWSLFQEVELPLTRVLLDMEKTGIRLDCYRLGEIAARLQDQMDGLEDSIYEAAGGTFNLSSPQQLSEVLFERLQLPRGRKTKTGYSTDAKTLEFLRPLHPIIESIETYRELSKLMSTYLLALPAAVDPNTERLHTTFHQAVTATGRLSSSDPNLQNIPVRTELGAQIRECFAAAQGNLLVVADYSQIELRIMAHLAGEPALLESFRRREDIHVRTAAEVFGLAEDEVDALHRRYAKAVNFGILYGISAFGLAQQLGIEREEAAQYIERYFERLPRVRSFIDGTIAAAKAQGFVATMLGRRRPIPELQDGSFQRRSLGERLAVNSVIQGSAADIIKVAMNRCHSRLRREFPNARLVLQIHDELLIEVPADEAERVRDVVVAEMVDAHPLNPPLGVDAGIGENWLAAK